jgi:hypothetical protein
MTLDDIRRQVNTILPGAIVRHHLLWRYSLLWVKPHDTDRSLIARLSGGAPEF